MNAVLMVATLVLAGCSGDHILPASFPSVVNLGLANLVPTSAPVISPDGRSIIFVRAVSPPPVIAHDRTTGVETTLFSVALGSSLWMADYHQGTLLFSVPNGGGARHIVEYTLTGGTFRDFDVTPGSQDFNASISPSGNQLAFMRLDGSGILTLSVRSVSSGSSPVNSYVSLPSGAIVLAVGWIDETHILVSARLGASGIVNELQDLTPGSAFSREVPERGLNAIPDPSGKHLALLDGSGTSLDVSLSGSEGGTRTPLTKSPSTKFGLNWSSHGDEIVYITKSGTPVVSSLELISLPPLQ